MVAEVVLADAPGDYSSSLTVTNAYGSGRPDSQVLLAAHDKVGNLYFCGGANNAYGDWFSVSGVLDPVIGTGGDYQMPQYRPLYMQGNIELASSSPSGKLDFGSEDEWGEILVLKNFEY